MFCVTACEAEMSETVLAKCNVKQMSVIDFWIEIELVPIAESVVSFSPYKAVHFSTMTNFVCLIEEWKQKWVYWPNEA